MNLDNFERIESVQLRINNLELRANEQRYQIY